jgi:hypothetical protein
LIYNAKKFDRFSNNSIYTIGFTSDFISACWQAWYSWQLLKIVVFKNGGTESHTATACGGVTKETTIYRDIFAVAPFSEGSLLST